MVVAMLVTAPAYGQTVPGPDPSPQPAPDPVPAPRVHRSVSVPQATQAPTQHTAPRPSKSILSGTPRQTTVVAGGDASRSAAAPRRDRGHGARSHRDSPSHARGGVAAALTASPRPSRLASLVPARGGAPSPGLVAPALALLLLVMAGGSLVRLTARSTAERW